MKKKILSLLLILTILFSIVACNKNEQPANAQTGENEPQEKVETPYYPVTIVDDAGNEIVLEEEPKKVASTAPSNTEIIFALGAEDKLVGVTDHCNYPEAALDIEKIGGFNTPNIEKVIELETDLLITGYITDDVKNQIEEAGTKVIMIIPSDLESVYKSIKTIGKALNKEEPAASLVEDMRGKQKDIVERVANCDLKRVFYEVWHEPLMSSGPGSFMDEMITLVKGENIAGDAESAYAEYSLEKLIEKDPQVYITGDDGYKTVDDIKAREGYEDISAIKDDRIYFLNPDIITIPGPRIIEALEQIASSIHPEAFYEK